MEKFHVCVSDLSLTLIAKTFNCILLSIVQNISFLISEFNESMLNECSLFKTN